MIFKISPESFMKLVTQFGPNGNYCEVTIDETKQPVSGIKFKMRDEVKATFRTLVVIQE